MLVDVTGSYTTDPSALLFHPQPPTRIYDSRLSGGAWAANETRAITVPAGRQLSRSNVTITEPAASGFVTVFPCQADLPVVSNLNYVAGQVVANLVQIGAANEQVCVYSSSAHTHRDRPAGNLRRQRRRFALPGRRRRRDSSTPVPESARCSDVSQWILASHRSLPLQRPGCHGAVPGNVEALMVSMIAVSPRASGWAEIGPCVEPAASTPYRLLDPQLRCRPTWWPIKPSPRPSWPPASTSARSPPPPRSTSSTSPAGSYNSAVWLAPLGAIPEPPIPISRPEDLRRRDTRTTNSDFAAQKTCAGAIPEPPIPISRPVEPAARARS